MCVPFRGLVGGVWVACFMMLPVTARAADRSVVPAADLQGWNELDVSARVSPRLDVTWSSQVRLSAPRENPTTYSSGLDFSVRVGDHLIVTPSYYVIASRTAAGAWAHTRVPILAATFWHGWGRWTLSNRSRVADVQGGGAGFWLLQNRPRVDYAVGPGDGGSSIFVWDEVSYYSVFHGWTRNRLALGARVVGSPRAAVDVYYVRQNDARTRPRRVDGVGVILEFRF
jgi:hypothetical protein